MSATRKEVYAALDGERDYQEEKWNENTTASAGRHSVGEFVVFMDNYLHEAKAQLSRMAEPAATEAALNTIRKITAMGVACMEQNGAPQREFDGPVKHVRTERPKGTAKGATPPRRNLRSVG